MRRRAFLQGALALPALSSLPRAAAQGAPPFRIYAVTWRGKTQVELGLMDHFAQQGIATDITWRDAAQNAARLEEFAREVKELRPDLVYTWGTPPTLGIAGPHDARDPGRYVTGIPLVFALVADPVAARIVPALKGHGRDITGVSHVAPIAAQVETMRAYRKFARVGVLYNAAEQNSVATVSSLKRLAAAQRFEVIESAFERDADGKAIPDGIPGKVAALKAAGAEWLYLGPDTYLFSQLDRIARAALEQRLATFSATEAALTTSAPVLTGLVSSYHTVGQFAAFKAGQILVKRMRAREIPIETLTRFAFMVRMEIAKQLDLLPPVALFNYAVIK